MQGLSTQAMAGMQGATPAQQQQALLRRLTPTFRLSEVPVSEEDVPVGQEASTAQTLSDSESDDDDEILDGGSMTSLSPRVLSQGCLSDYMDQ